MLRVDQQQRPAVLQQIVDRAPVDATNDVAKRALEWSVSIVIPRERLQPADGRLVRGSTWRAAGQPEAGSAAAAGGRHGGARPAARAKEGNGGARGV
jgi:hypothetical protein